MTQTYRRIPSSQRSDESGRSLVEMLGTIAIITMITIGGIAGSGVAMTSYRTMVAQDDVEQIIQGVQDLYSWRRDYPNNSQQMMRLACENDVLPKKCEGKDYWWSSFGTEMKVIANGSENFSVEIANVPASACRSLLQKEWAMVDAKSIYVSNGGCPEGRRGTRTMRFSPKTD